MAAAKKGPNANYLEQQAETVRQSLVGSHKDEVFKLAVEAGYLTALADGTEDANEREALVSAIGVLSQGMVIEWEIEGFLGEAYARIQAEGADGRAASVGARLKELESAEAGLLIGAIVACATSGVDKKEAGVLEKIGAAAGIAKSQVGSIVKKARA